MLEGLLAEDDSVPDVWYLAGLCAHAGGDFEAALEAIAAGEHLLRAQGRGAKARASPKGAPAEAGEAGEDALAIDFTELRVRALLIPSLLYKCDGEHSLSAYIAAHLRHELSNVSPFKSHAKSLTVLLLLLTHAIHLCDLGNVLKELSEPCWQAQAAVEESMANVRESRR